MPSRQFANRKALLQYAKRHGLVYLWDGTPLFAKWQRLLSLEQYEIVEVQTSRRGVRSAMLFAKPAQAERDAADPPGLMAIKRAQRAAKREEAKKERRAAQRAMKKD
jgi:hypothetical protein